MEVLEDKNKNKNTCTNFGKSKFKLGNQINSWKRK